MLTFCVLYSLMNVLSWTRQELLNINIIVMYLYQLLKILPRKTFIVYFLDNKRINNNKNHAAKVSQMIIYVVNSNINLNFAFILVSKMVFFKYQFFAKECEAYKPTSYIQHEILQNFLSKSLMTPKAFDTFLCHLIVTTAVLHRQQACCQLQKKTFSVHLRILC